jgi:hypothetical protein
MKEIDEYDFADVDLINLHLGKIDKSFYLPSLVSKKGTTYDTSYVVLRYENDVTLSIFNSSHTLE